MVRSRLTKNLIDKAGFGFGRLNTGSKISVIFLFFILLIALFAPWIATHDPLQSGIPAQPPSSENFFGTDRIGRDVFSRLVYGSQVSLIIGLGAVFVALLIGAVLGSVAAISRRWIGDSLMRLLDVFMSFPAIALAAVLIVAFGNSLFVLVVSIAIVYCPQLARVIRANVLAEWQEDYVRAERVIGARPSWILIKHILRNTAAPILVFATVMVADAIVFEASLSLLGAGIKPPDPSWGNVIAYGRNLVLNGGWWATTFPGLTILLTVLALNILAEGLSDALSDPKSAKSAKVDDQEESKQEKLDLRYHDPKQLDFYLSKLSESEAKRTDRMVFEDSAPKVLSVQDLCIRFPKRYGNINLVDRVSFDLHEGEVMGLVGESGCGKSITSFSIMGLLQNAQFNGKIMFKDREGKEHNLIESQEIASLRGVQISMIYQDALSSLNPCMKIESQIKQILELGSKHTAEELLSWVKLDTSLLERYPHELSGGQRQRILIAMALAHEPRLVIADEPTTALDVTVQAEVITLLNELRVKLGFAMIFVSHDLALVASIAHKITVMYAGQVVESAQTSDLLKNPQHEYTKGLLACVFSSELGSERLYQIPGSVPSPFDFVDGDRFAPRSTL